MTKAKLQTIVDEETEHVENTALSISPQRADTIIETALVDGIVFERRMKLDNPGDAIAGIFRGFRVEEVTNEKGEVKPLSFALIEPRPGMTISLCATSQVERELKARAKIGDKVAIVREGTIETRRGHRMFSYVIGVKSS